jgi:serpin B
MSLALSLTANGARGQTQADMVKTLDPKNPSIEAINKLNNDIIHLVHKEEGTEFSLANAIFTRVTPLQDYQNLAISTYHAQVDNLQGKDQINAYVSNKTHGKIEKVYDEEISADTKMLIINTIFFSKQWSKSFGLKNEKEDFKNSNNSVSKVQYLQKQLDYVSYYQDSKVEVVEVPMDDTEYGFYVLLPQADINTYVNNLTDEEFTGIFAGMKEDFITLTVPEFKVEFSSSMKDVLKKMGMEIAFSETAADFKNMTAKENLFIGDVIHKTYMKVDRYGLEAAAVTVVEMRSKSLGRMHEYKSMYVNRPFLVVIKHMKQGHVMFFGKIEQL